MEQCGRHAASESQNKEPSGASLQRTQLCTKTLVLSSKWCLITLIKVKGCVWVRERDSDMVKHMDASTAATLEQVLHRTVNLLLHVLTFFFSGHRGFDHPPRYFWQPSTEYYSSRVHVQTYTTWLLKLGLSGVLRSWQPVIGLCSRYEIRGSNHNENCNKGIYNISLSC